MSRGLPELPSNDNRVVRPDLGALIGDEFRYREEQKFFGSWDMLLAVKSIPALGIAELMQQDLDAHPDLGGSKDPFTLMAEAPWDWKAVAVSVGVYAVGSAAARINQRRHLDTQLVEAAQQVREGATLTPYTTKEVKQNRFLEKAKRGVLTAAGCVVAYKVGEHGTLTQDLVAEGALITGAMASVGVVNAHSKRKINRILHPRRQSTEVVHLGDYVDGHVAYEEDRNLRPSVRNRRELNS
jgi:hypothetical protein